MFKLSELVPLAKKRKRVGRGGSRGGTSGSGHKGQKARSGPKIDPGFEGGQMPLYRRLPKRGFNNTQFRVPIRIINIGRLNDAFEQDEVVNKESLVARRLIRLRKGEHNVLLKVLGQGELLKKLLVYADIFSESARLAIENIGGEVHLIGEIK